MGFATYLNTVFRQRFPARPISLGNSRELSTLARTLDALLSGNVGRACDCLVQRFKALESAVTEGHWGLAKHYELIPQEEVSLTSTQERQVLAKRQLLFAKLDEAKRRAKE